jgi:hypothetical protein
MAIVRFALDTPAADTDTLLHTADRQSIASVIATNKGAASATVRVWVQPSGAASAADYAYISYDTEIPIGNSLETFRFAIENNDDVYVRASTADISFSLNGIHESTANFNKVTVQDTAPTAPTIGDVWVSEALGYVKFWDGSTWVNAVPGSAGYAQTTEPQFPQEGQLWVDIDGTVVEPGYATVIYSPTQPTGLDITDTGTIWIDSATSESFVWTGTEFVAMASAVSIDYQADAPTSPETGALWIDSDGSSSQLNSNDFLLKADAQTLYVSKAEGADASDYTPSFFLGGF